MLPEQGSGSPADEGFVNGNAEELGQNLDAIRQYQPDAVVVISADHVYLLNYANVVEVPYTEYLTDQGLDDRGPVPQPGRPQRSKLVSMSHRQANWAGADRECTYPARRLELRHFYARCCPPAIDHFEPGTYRTPQTAEWDVRTSVRTLHELLGWFGALVRSLGDETGGLEMNRCAAVDKASRDADRRDQSFSSVRLEPPNGPVVDRCGQARATVSAVHAPTIPSDDGCTDRNVEHCVKATRSVDPNCRPAWSHCAPFVLAGRQGAQDDDQVGVWQSLNLKTGPIRSFDGFAQEFTVWPDSGNIGAPVVERGEGLTRPASTAAEGPLGILRVW